MQTSKGKIQRAQKVVVYGPEGIGKSTFLSMFPGMIFIDTEGSTYHMDVERTPKPSSWTMILEQVKYYKNNPHLLNTLAIDTADWAESLCAIELSEEKGKDGIEGFGYGKGYKYLAEKFGALLNLLEELIDVGINVAIAAHAQISKFDLPDETGSYNRWEMKLTKYVHPLLKEWADMVLFANYKILVINVDNQGAAKGKNKAQGGKRVMYTSHHPCWDAKNRHNLSEELLFDYKQIAHCIPVLKTITPPTPKPATTPTSPEQLKSEQPATTAPQQPTHQPAVLPTADDMSKVPKALADLMKMNGVTIEQIQKAVAHKGYYPEDTPIENYDSNFIQGVLVAAWTQVYGLIQSLQGEEKPY